MSTQHVHTRDEVRANVRAGLDALRAERDASELNTESTSEVLPMPLPVDRVPFDAERPTGAGHRADDDRRADASKKESQGTAIVRLVRAAGVELFHTPAGESYITIEMNGHREHHSLVSRGGRDYLTRIFYFETRRAPSAAGLQEAIATLSGMARFDGNEHEVRVRIVGANDRIYLDLGDSSHRAVEITPTGWEVVADCPIRFRRPNGLLALPAPERGGSIEDLRPFVNLATDDDFLLLVMWELAAFRPRGPYPILVFMAEQGAAKTTTTRILRRLCDPNASDVRRPARNTEDLMIAATNGHIVAFDNLSRLSEDLSDNLSVLATGGGFAVRLLYTNKEEELFQAQRPIILNGISQVATRGDLLDRAIALSLPPIPEERRRDEATFWREFEQARPRILGALLDAVSCGLKRAPSVRLERKPRMADFAVWGVAVEPACPWREGSFLRVYSGNQRTAVDSVLDGDPVAEVVRKIAPWTGTASELLILLTQTTAANITNRRDWFARPRQVSDALRRLAPGLRRIGFDVAFEKQGRDRTRLIVITNLASSASSASSASPDGQGFCADAAQGRVTDPSANPPNVSGVPNAADDADEVIQSFANEDEWERTW